MASQQTHFQVRRIFLAKEAEEIFTLQADADEFRRHYPKHAEWLRMAIREITDGKRFAFGVYQPGFNGTSLTPVLVGSIIIKTEVYSRTMQLKNLYIKPDARGHHYGTALFSAVERFCVRRGGTSIETEVPVAEDGTVSFLSRMGFFVISHFASPYKPHDTLYRMAKPLPRLYIGDPFDLHAIGRWIIEHSFDFTITSTDRDWIDFAKPATGSTLQSPLSGRALVIDKPEPISAKVISDRFSGLPHHLAGVICRHISEEARTACDARRLFWLDRQRVDDLLRNALASEKPPFEREEIGGVIAPMRPVYLSRLKDIATPRTYYKGGPIGSSLKPGDIVLFYAEAGGKVEPGIHAYAHITAERTGSPELVWADTEGLGPMFDDREQYLAWSVDKNEVVALTFSNVQWIKQMNLERIRHLFPSHNTADDDRLGKLYVSRAEIATFLKEAAALPNAASGVVAGGPSFDVSHQSSLRDRLTTGENPTYEYVKPSPPADFDDVNDREFTQLVRSTDVLLVAARDVERDAMLALLQPLKRRKRLVRRARGQETYLLGRLGKHSAVLVMCRGGVGERDAAALSVKQAVDICHPRAVVGIGIAFGGYTDKLKIGDVIVSSRVIFYEPQRVQSGGSLRRGSQPDAGPTLLNRFGNFMGWTFKRPDAYTCKVEIGPFLSGEKLVDSLDFKEQLFMEYPEAIGGEMEAMGVAAACERAEVRLEWIVVKAISDWGDGTKGDKHRPLAAAASASLVKHVLSTTHALDGL